MSREPLQITMKERRHEQAARLIREGLTLLEIREKTGVHHNVLWRAVNRAVELGLITEEERVKARARPGKGKGRRIDSDCLIKDYENGLTYREMAAKHNIADVLYHIKKLAEAGRLEMRKLGNGK